MSWARTLLRLVFGDWRHVLAVFGALCVGWLAARTGYPAAAGVAVAGALLLAAPWLV